MESGLTELEIKLGLNEDHLEQLNRTVFRQQQQIDLLQAQIRELYQLIQPESTGQARNLRDEIPPHY
jgi:SlyX protein